jgi:alpha-D-xyloside xylohydrolase
MIKQINTYEKISTFIFITLLFLSTGSWAQQYKKTPVGIKTTIDSIELELQFYSPDIVRVLKSPAGIPYEKKVFQ